MIETSGIGIWVVLYPSKVAKGVRVSYPAPLKGDYDYKSRTIIPSTAERKES